MGHSHLEASPLGLTARKPIAGATEVRPHGLPASPPASSSALFEGTPIPHSQAKFGETDSLPRPGAQYLKLGQSKHPVPWLREGHVAYASQ